MKTKHYGGGEYGYAGGSYGYAPGGFTGILDRLTTQPHVAYSPTQRLTRRHTGPVLVARRSSDSTTHDVYGNGPNGTVLASELRTLNGWNLIRNTVFENTAGTSPTSFTYTGTGASAAESSTIYAGETAWRTNSSAEQAWIGQTFTARASTTYLFSVIIESVVGSANANRVINIATIPSGSVVSWPSCTANPAGGTSNAITAGELQVQIVVSTTAGTPQLRLGSGANGASVTLNILFSRPQLEIAASRSTYEPRTNAQGGAGDLTLQTTYDQMGTGLNYTQGTSTLQPLLVEQGVPCVDDAGNVMAKHVAASSLRMTVASSTGSFNYMHTTGVVALSVCKPSTTATARFLFANKPGDTQQGIRLYYSGTHRPVVEVGRLDVAGVATGGISVQHVVGSGSYTANHVMVIDLDPDNATAGDRSVIRINGDVLTGSNSQTGTPFVENANSNLTLGALSNGGSAFDGLIGTEIFFNTPSLPTADRELLEEYLIDLQGIT